MPRKVRLLVSHCPHHIVQRGHNRQAVFLADDDYQFYLANLNEWKQKLGIKLYAWCLMTNHVHLVVDPGDDTKVISELMKRIAGRQAAYVNKLEKRTGALWEGRFKASPIQRDQYLLACIRYIEMNPVRAGMVSGPRQYRWSSYRERTGLVRSTMLDFDECFYALSDDALQRIERYKQYIQSGTSDKELEQFRVALQRNKLTGNERFVDEVEVRLGMRVAIRKRGRPVNQS